MTAIAQEALAARGIRVKALEWRDGRLSDTSERFTADTPFGAYEAMKWSDETFGGTMSDGVEFGDLDSLEAAKSAAQSDFAARILAALEVTHEWGERPFYRCQFPACMGHTATTCQGPCKRTGGLIPWKDGSGGDA